MSNKFDEKRKIELEDLTPNNLQELYDSKYEIQISDLVKCENCGSIYPRDAVQMDTRIIEVPHDNWDYIRGEYYDTITREEDEYFYCPDCHFGEDEGEELETYDFTNSDLFDFDFDIEKIDDYITDEFKEAYKKFMNDKMEESKMVKSKNNKMTLEEATIKSLYDQLDDSEKKKSVDGIVNDILVVTDPEISSDEYDELIDRANEIVEETEEGDIPLNDEYLGQYVQMCPICGSTFVEDHILEPGTACPICLDTPEAFVMVGQLQYEDDVAEDEGIKQPEESEENKSNIEGGYSDTDEFNKSEENEEENVRQLASEVITNADNKLEEDKPLTEDVLEESIESSLDIESTPKYFRSQKLKEEYDLDIDTFAVYRINGDSNFEPEEFSDGWTEEGLAKAKEAFENNDVFAIQEASSPDELGTILAVYYGEDDFKQAWDQYTDKIEINVKKVFESLEQPVIESYSIIQLSENLEESGKIVKEGLSKEEAKVQIKEMKKESKMKYVLKKENKEIKKECKNLNGFAAKLNK